MSKKPCYYLAGPVTGIPDFLERFDWAQDLLEIGGLRILSPARTPSGMTNEAYAHIGFDMIDQSEGIILLPGWEHSAGSLLEKHYTEYVGKKVLNFEDLEGSGSWPF